MKNQQDKTLTPTLRFPEFRRDGEWSTRPLDELCERILEKVGDVRLTPVSITAGRGFVAQAEKFGRDISGAQYKNYIRLRRGEFAYNKGNSNLYPQGCVYQLKEFDEAAASNAFICFRLKDGNAPGFFQGLFEKNAHGLQLLKFLTSGARSDGLLNIKADEFFSVSLPIPPDPAEQRKIAACLTSLDELLAAEGRKLQALRAHKKGLMQQLFPREGETVPRLRFPEFRGEPGWEESPIGSLCDLYQSETIPSSQFVPNGPHLVYGANGVVGRLDRYNHEESTVIVSCRGNCGEVHLTQPKSWITGNSMVVAPRAQGIAPLFLYWLLKASDLSRIVSGSAQPQITRQGFAPFLIRVPKPAEQHRIAACLSLLDDLIAAQSQKLDALKTHKKGLMQQLFPSPERV